MTSRAESDPVAGAPAARGVVAWRVVVPVLLVMALAFRVGVILNHEIDPDESQHLHVAWLIGQGQVPYRDFWEHHVPLFHYLLAPLVRALLDQPAVYFAGRLVMVAAAAAAVALTWRLGRRLGAAAGGWAALVLAWLPQFAQNTTEIRPDVFALVAHLACLTALVRWRESRALSWALAAGLAEGAALALSLKAALAIVGVGLVVLLAPGDRGGRPRRAALAALAAGVALPPAGLVLGLAAQGGTDVVRLMAGQVVGQTARFVDFAKAWPLFGSEVGALAVALVGLGFVLRVRGRTTLAHPVHGTLLPPTAVLIVLLAWPRTPAVYQQAWLPVLPVVAIYCGLGLAALLRWAEPPGSRARASVAGVALILALGPPALESTWLAFRARTADPLRVMRAELAAACRGEPVLDGTALYVFRPHAYRYGVLVTGVREWVARGMVPEEALEADMRAARAPVAYPDRRLRAMIGPVATFLRQHYVAGPEGLLLAGVEVAAGPPGGRVYVTLLVPGPYEVVVPPATEVALDQAEVRAGWRRLEAGRHELTWRGQGGLVRLRAATCVELAALGVPTRASALTPPRSGG